MSCVLAMLMLTVCAEGTAPSTGAEAAATRDTHWAAASSPFALRIRAGCSSGDGGPAGGEVAEQQQSNDGVAIFDECMTLADAMLSRNKSTGQSKQLDGVRQHLTARIRTFVEQHEGTDAWNRVTSRVSRKTHNYFPAREPGEQEPFAHWLHSFSPTRRPLATNMNVLGAVAACQVHSSGARKLASTATTSRGVHLPRRRMAGRCVLCSRKVAMQSSNTSAHAPGSGDNSSKSSRSISSATLDRVGASETVTHVLCRLHRTSALNGRQHVVPRALERRAKRCNKTDTAGTLQGEKAQQGARLAHTATKHKRLRVGAPTSLNRNTSKVTAAPGNSSLGTSVKGRARVTCCAPEGCTKQPSFGDAYVRKAKFCVSHRAPHHVCVRYYLTTS
jgi:hypothetical protein